MLLNVNQERWNIMFKKLLSTAIVLIMCLSLVTSVTAYDDVEIIDVGCCSDHDVWLNHFNVEPINFNTGIATLSFCTHSKQRTDIVTTRDFISTHYAPTRCDVYLNIQWRRIWCDLCNAHLHSTEMSRWTSHTLVH